MKTLSLNYSPFINPNGDIFLSVNHKNDYDIPVTIDRDEIVEKIFTIQGDDFEFIKVKEEYLILHSHNFIFDIGITLEVGKVTRNLFLRLDFTDEVDEKADDYLRENAPYGKEFE